MALCKFGPSCKLAPFNLAIIFEFCTLDVLDAPWSLPIMV